MSRHKARMFLFPAGRDRRLITRMVDVLERTPAEWKRRQYLLSRQSTLSKRWASLGLTDAQIDEALADLGTGLRKEIAWRRARRAALVDPTINHAMQRAEDERAARDEARRTADE